MAGIVNLELSLNQGTAPYWINRGTTVKAVNKKCVGPCLQSDEVEKKEEEPIPELLSPSSLLADVQQKQLSKVCWLYAYLFNFVCILAITYIIAVVLSWW